MQAEYTLTTSDPWTMAAVIVGFLVGFAILWYAIGRLLARLSGWRALAARFPRGDQRPDRRWWFRSGSMGKLQISAGFVLGASARAFHLAVVPGFVGFPPCAIPWDQLDVVESGRWSVRLRVKGDGPAIRVPARVWRAAQELRSAA